VWGVDIPKLHTFFSFVAPTPTRAPISYLLKVASFSYPSCLWLPPSGSPHRNIIKALTIENKSPWATVLYCLPDTFCFLWWTNGRMDRHSAMRIPR